MLITHSGDPPLHTWGILTPKGKVDQTIRKGNNNPGTLTPSQTSPMCTLLATTPTMPSHTPILTFTLHDRLALDVSDHSPPIYIQFTFLGLNSAVGSGSGRV